jgi:hypothetical protein
VVLQLYPYVGFSVTNMTGPAERVVAFYNQRGTAEQWIKEGKNAIKWTQLSCCSFAANAVRLQLHALAYNLANFMRTLALPEAVNQWSLTSLREKLVKIGAEVARGASLSRLRHLSANSQTFAHSHNKPAASLNMYGCGYRTATPNRGG